MSVLPQKFCCLSPDQIPLYPQNYYIPKIVPPIYADISRAGVSLQIYQLKYMFPAFPPQLLLRNIPLHDNFLG
jgi:hypothetical protein